MAEKRDGEELFWFDPPKRGVLPIDGMHVPRRLQRTIRQRPYAITFDRAFEDVIRGCQNARPETWINDEIVALYTALHRKGFAHSVEAWKEDQLVGGVYGVSIGAAFFGESMFSRARDASKICLVHLTAHLWRQGYLLFDAQFTNDHLKQFGIMEIPRAEYRARLAAAIKEQVDFGETYSAVSSASSTSSGADSEENASGFGAVAAFLHSITQTS